MPDRITAILAALALWRLLTADLLNIVAFSNTTLANVHAALAKAQRRGLVRGTRCGGGYRVYSLTAKGAAAVGLTGSVFRRPAGVQSIFDRLPINYWAIHAGVVLLTPQEVREYYPLYASAGGCLSRYFVERDGGVERVMYVAPSIRASIASTVHKVRSVVERHKKNPLVRAAIYRVPPSFGVLIVTHLEAKAQRLREALANDKFHHKVCVVDLGNLLF